MGSRYIEFKYVTPFDPKTPAEYESSLVFSRTFWIETTDTLIHLTDSASVGTGYPFREEIKLIQVLNARRTLGNVKTTAHGKYICRKVDRNFFIKFVHIPDATKAGTTGHF